MLIAGARPNFMKIASIIDAINVFNGSPAARQYYDQADNRSTVAQRHSNTIQYLLVHTGQHYDDSMSEAFFRDLELPKPDIHLEVGSASHAVQTAEIMKRFEPVLIEHEPDVVMVVGDVNSTVACSLVAAKIKYHSRQGSNTASPRHFKGLRPLIAHVEAGLRSFDRSMPEEINRILTDQLSDFLFVSEQSGLENLKKEGFKNILNAEDVSREDYALRLAPHNLPIVAFVGNTMIDTLLKHRQLAKKSTILKRLGLGPAARDPQNIDALSESSVSISQNLELNTHHSTLITQHSTPQTNNSTNPMNPINSTNSITPYAVLTLHRPSNVDDKETFEEILEALSVISKKIPIFFPVHPRTLNRIKEFGFEKYFNFLSSNSTLSAQNSILPPTSTLRPVSSGIHCLDPLGYFDFLCLMSNAKLVLTDSGGIQEETTVLSISCVTLRKNTERPVTTTHGTNILAGTKKEKIVESVYLQLNRYDQGGSHKSVKPNQLNKPNEFNEPNNSVKPKFWDGRAGQRVIDILVDYFIEKNEGIQKLETSNEKPE